MYVQYNSEMHIIYLFIYLFINPFSAFPVLCSYLIHAM